MLLSKVRVGFVRQAFASRAIHTSVVQKVQEPTEFSKETTASAPPQAARNAEWPNKGINDKNERRGLKKNSVLNSLLAQGGNDKRPGPDHRQYQNKFQPQEIYMPRDLNERFERVKREMTQGKKVTDPFKQLGINPLDEYKNVMLLSRYISDMGRIKPKHVTKLSAKSQRKVSKAIRRARAFGLIPFTYKPNSLLNLDGSSDFNFN